MEELERRVFEACAVDPSFACEPQDRLALSRENGFLPAHIKPAEDYSLKEVEALTLLGSIGASCDERGALSNGNYLIRQGFDTIDWSKTTPVRVVVPYDICGDQRVRVKCLWDGARQTLS